MASPRGYDLNPTLRGAVPFQAPRKRKAAHARRIGATDRQIDGAGGTISDLLSTPQQYNDFQHQLQHP